MRDWNVVATAHEERFSEAFKLLEPYGRVEKTAFYNILAMYAVDPRGLLQALENSARQDPASLAPLSRVMPIAVAFAFHSPEEFEMKSREAMADWIPSLAGRTFHVRMHRRGFKGKLSSMNEERFLDIHLLEALEHGGNPGRITFDDPDAIIAVETIDNRAGLSLWTREDLRRHPLLHLD